MIKSPYSYLFIFAQLLCYPLSLIANEQGERIPFYEDYIESGQLDEFIKQAHEFLDQKADQAEAPRVALDLLMMGKAAEDLKAVVRGTDLLLFDYLGSLPSLHFLSTFDPGSKRLTELLKVKAADGNLSSDQFAQSYASAISLLARLQGPQLLSDSDLRLRCFLILSRSENIKLFQSIEKGVKQLVENKDALSPIAKILLNDAAPIKKFRQLSKLSLKESEFFKKYYLAQLSEKEKSSADFIQLLIEINLFSQSTNPIEAVKLIENSDEKLKKNKKFLLWHAYALLLAGQKDEALEKIAQLVRLHGVQEDDWVKTAKSMANGIEFAESRNSLLLEQLEKVHKNLNSSSDSLRLDAIWNVERNGSTLSFEIVVGTSILAQSFEIQVVKDKKPFFFYRTDGNRSSLFTPDGILHQFAEKGPYPLPIVDLTRDPTEGTFNYKFNLNFGRTFESLSKQANDLLQNSYLGTSKGREVLTNYIFNRKGVWITPPESLESGTLFTLESLTSDAASPNRSLIETDLSGNLRKVQIGGLTLKSIQRGERNEINPIPEWPKFPKQEKHDTFQLPLLITALENIMGK